MLWSKTDHLPMFFLCPEGERTLVVSDTALSGTNSVKS